MSLDIFSLDGRTAVVTGASRGIGQALATGLARAGADIIAVARRHDGLSDTRGAVEATGRRCHTIASDVSDVAAVTALFREISDRGLGPDILVNNAGTEAVAPAVDVSEAQWDTIVDTNLKGAFFVAQAFARAAHAAGRGGAVVNLGSLASSVGIPTAVPYTSSKAGILGMTRALAAEWAPQIRVNAIGPGYFRTAMTEGFYQSEGWQDAMLGRIPMGRFGNLDDLVGVTVFLVSDASSYVTGEIVAVDGGTLASI